MRTIRSENITKLSATKEDYVRAIYLLREDKSKQPTVTQIAHRLGLSKSTVSGRINDLVKENLVITSPYSDIVLSESGERIAKKLTYKHRLIEVFLNQTLNMPVGAVHVEAEKLEHACSDDVVQRLAYFLDHPTKDPHGTRIDAPEKW